MSPCSPDFAGAADPLSEFRVRSLMENNHECSRLCMTLVGVTLRALGLLCTFLGSGFLSLGGAFARVGAMCRDASTAREGNAVDDSIVLYDGEEIGAPIWYYDVKLAVASTSSIGIREGRKWYAVRKGREVGIFDTWETCKSHVHGYRGSEFQSFRKLSDAYTYLHRKN